VERRPIQLVLRGNLHHQLGKLLLADVVCVSAEIDPTERSTHVVELVYSYTYI
jgi:hypothetical protein